MCIFSGKVSRVEGTNIFARRTGKNKQAIIYQMEVSLTEPVAMILPIPVKTPASEKSITFHNFSRYKNFFTQLDRVINKEMIKKSASKKAAAASPTLTVHDVGSFEASFVPSIQDFDRLDERFRLPKEVWKSLPQYKNYGFAVFQLKAGEEVEVHPMAFEFTTRDTSRLFFPTVHIHNGQSVTKKAHFSHWLYFQGAKTDYQKDKKSKSRFAIKHAPMLQGKTKTSASSRNQDSGQKLFSEYISRFFINEKKACGLIKESLPAHRVRLSGRKPNVDHWVSFEPLQSKQKAPTKKVTKKKVAAKPSPKKPAAKKLAKTNKR